MNSNNGSWQISPGDPIFGPPQNFMNQNFIAIPVIYNNSNSVPSQGNISSNNNVHMPYIFQPGSFPNINQASPSNIAIIKSSIYVNPKQYDRILKRRSARNILRKKTKPPEGKKEYLHESRHNHACRRPRGPGGRFLTKEDLANMEITSSMTNSDTSEPPFQSNSFAPQS